ncbi:MAG: hypothetical protein RLZZ387_5381 [Chloroflexota bacterium]|jgi:Flp pilus assembly protein TadG
MVIRHARVGQSLVEFALTATILLTLLLGAVDFARAYTAQVAIKNAVAEAGYFAAQNPGKTSAIRQAVKTELRDFSPAVTDDHITVQCSGISGTEQTLVRVQYDYPLLFSFLIPGAMVTLRSETTVPQMGGC